ncbi:sodium:proton antiporter [Flavobacterium sp. MFBS3-15]|uniref:cation:proton antiporter n=1 Tax=Flavobacterium sp. MFBS3-15 TaxID=2989816 RepID=UPI0022364ECB|nr:sodium:proton antiporter [Flavobacterium sp. MFBS3-15]MCW4468962.1 sodium:proton antiporter [Flavobacterium sp. MFBS3-15]
MNGYHLLVILISLSAGFAYINHRYIKMPFVIGLFFLSSVLSLFVLSARWWDLPHYEEIRGVLAKVNLNEFILDIMLGFLLFAGSLHTHWADIKKQIRPISLFAVGGVVISTILIAFMLSWISGFFGVQVDFMYCLIFGALISPTDPIAVLGILTKANVSKKIESTIVGESLFNDGVGVVIFIALLETIRKGGGEVDFGDFGMLFLQEAVGGILFGLLLGIALHKLLKSIDNYETEVLLTVAFVMAGYSISAMMHLSGALAMVVMGLLVGNYKRELSMSDKTQEYVHKFWELVDVILNAILFISIAFVLVVIDFDSSYIIVGLLSVLIVLLSRIIIVYLPKILVPRWVNLSNNEAGVIIWGGLRGGLSIALVLSLPEGENKLILMVATYACVVFSILVQGLTIGKVAKRLSK